MKLTSLVLVLFLAACSVTNGVTYENVDDKIEQAETPEEKEKLVKWRDKFEEDIPKAQAWFEYRAACIADNNSVWACRDVHPSQLNKVERIKSLDDMMRYYRQRRFTCGCVATRL